MSDVDLFSLLISVRGISYLIGGGILGIQQDVIRKQKNILNTYEENTSSMESLLNAIIERQDVPPDIKKLAQETIEKFKLMDE